MGARWSTNLTLEMKLKFNPKGNHDIVDRSQMWVFFSVITSHFSSAHRFDYTWSVLIYWWFKTRSIKSHQSLPHYHHHHHRRPRQSPQVLKRVCVCVRVCVSLWSTQEERASDLARIWTASLISQSQTEGERRSPLTERIKYPWVGTSQLPLTTTPFPSILLFLRSLPPPVYPGYHWVSRGAAGKGERARKRRGEKKVKERLCGFKSQEDIWVHEDFDCFTHTGSKSG